MKEDSYHKKNSDISLGIDLGGTKLSAAIVDSDGTVLKHELIKTNASGPKAVVNDIVKLTKRLTSDGSLLSAVGVGMAGQIDKNDGTVIFAPNLGWKNFPLGKELESALEIPAFITNDVRAATYGEWFFGAGKECSDLLCLFFGTGIGSGVVSGGNILNGSDNAFGEVGHMTIDLHGSLCTCGNIGCFETKASGWGLAKNAKEVLKNEQGSLIVKKVNGLIEDVTTNIIFEAFRENDPTAIKLVNEFKEALVAGISSLLNLYNPSKLILGGGIIQGNLDLIDFVREKIQKRALKATSEHVKIVPAKLGSTAGIVGAAVFAARKIK